MKFFPLLSVVSQPGNGRCAVLLINPVTLRPAEAAPRALQPRVGHPRVRKQAMVSAIAEAKRLPRYHRAQGNQIWLFVSCNQVYTTVV